MKISPSRIDTAWDLDMDFDMLDLCDLLTDILQRIFQSLSKQR